MTVYQVADAIKKRLSRDFKRPWVEVAVSEYHGLVVRVFGELEPSSWRISGSGEYSLRTETKVFDFFISIGGLPKTADKKNLKLFRKDTAERVIDFDKIAANPGSEDNIYLRDGDVIFVPSQATSQISVRVTVLGRIGKQGVLNLEPEHSGLVDAISESGGFSEAAALDRVQVLRTEGTLQKTETVNASAIISGAAPDFALQDGDLIYVPERNEKRKTLARVNTVLNNILPSFNFIYLISRF
jgi:protein involved in polysaccharide export with SLBB domain